MTKTLATLGLLFSLSTVSLGAKDSWPVGVYRVEGVNPDGSKYVGAVQVEAEPESQLFTVIWKTDGGDEKTYALGYVHNKMFVVVGVSSFLLGSWKDNGEGRWLTPNQDAPAIENWKRTNFKTLDEAIKPVARPKSPKGLQVREI